MGFIEIVLLIVILLAVFGAGKLPAIGDALGRTVKSFRRAARGLSDENKPKPQETPDQDPRG